MPPSRPLRALIAAIAAIYLFALRVRVLRGVPRACRLAVHLVIHWRHRSMTRAATAAGAIRPEPTPVDRTPSDSVGDRVRIAGLVW